MISHQDKLIFIHIPKCAGSSFEKLLKGRPFDWREPDYDRLVGWCPKRRIHLQHATARQLLELELVDEDIWNTYFKFAFVRNPWDRAMSDYFWMRRETGVRDSFYHFLKRRGGFKKVLSNKDDKFYRGDHLDEQIGYIQINGKIVVDFLGRFESINTDYEVLKTKIPNLLEPRLPHEQKGKKKFHHYSSFYFRRSKKWVREIYQKDIEAFGYSFESPEYSLVKPGQEWKKTLFALYYHSSLVQRAHKLFSN